MAQFKAQAVHDDNKYSKLDKKFILGLTSNSPQYQIQIPIQSSSPAPSI